MKPKSKIPAWLRNDLFYVFDDKITIPLEAFKINHSYSYYLCINLRDYFYDY